MIPKISVCVFIKNNNSGAFGLWESMATLMPIANEFFVMDLGSTDGTHEILKDLASKNKKIHLEQGEFPINPVTGLVDAGSFAELPNAMIPTCKNDIVLYYQADEIWHDNLVKMMVDKLSNKYKFDGFSFWRYQLRDNFQKIKWFPHIVHRMDYKDRFVLVDDGMNTNRTNDAELISNYDGGWFTRWGAEYSKGRSYRVDGNGNPYIYGEEERMILDGQHASKLPTHEMILDISSIGGFLNNIVFKRKEHAPLWRDNEENINIDGISFNLDNWYKEQLNNPDWTKETTIFDIPDIMKYHLGRKDYTIREDILNKIANA